METTDPKTSERLDFYLIHSSIEDAADFLRSTAFLESQKFSIDSPIRSDLDPHFPELYQSFGIDIFSKHNDLESTKYHESNDRDELQILTQISKPKGSTDFVLIECKKRAYPIIYPALLSLCAQYLKTAVFHFQSWESDHRQWHLMDIHDFSDRESSQYDYLRVFAGRHVECEYEDGRWKFSQDGEPAFFEDAELYKSRRVSNRFNRSIILEYLLRLGIDFEQTFGNRDFDEVYAINSLGEGERLVLSQDEARPLELFWDGPEQT